MISILLGLLAIFPFSFLFFAMSERLVAKHQSRVGKDIDFGGFCSQTWLNSWIDIKNKKSAVYWCLFVLQCSIVFVLDVNVAYLAFIYIALNAYALAQWNPQTVSGGALSVGQKIRADRAEVRYAAASVIAVLCLFGSFTLSKSTSLAEVQWSWLSLLFVVPFQLAGMILFGEPPFQGSENRPNWLESARFYVWSMLCVQLFMGGSLFVLDLHIKAAVIYVSFRLCGIYFPRFQQRDLLRICIYYLFPITGLIWLSVVLLGIFLSGDAHV